MLEIRIVKPILYALVALLAPVSVHQAPASPAIPWLYNFDDVVASTDGDLATAFRLTGFGDPDDRCDPGEHVGFAVHADLGPGAADVTVMSSYAEGVVVVGSEGRRLASTPGFVCQGSADELEVLAVGRAFTVPTIVVVATTGGRREQITWVGLYRVGREGRLDPVFVGAVEQREDGIVRRGAITLLPGALIYRAPGAGEGLWVFDPVVHTFTPRGPLDPEAEPHS